MKVLHCVSTYKLPLICMQVRRGYYYGTGACYCMSASLMDAGEKYFR